MNEITIFGLENEETLELEDKIYRAVMKLHIDVLVGKEENINTFLKYGLTRIPAVMFNDRIIIDGERLNLHQIEEILRFHISSSPGKA